MYDSWSSNLLLVVGKGISLDDRILKALTERDGADHRKRLREASDCSMVWVLVNCSMDRNSDVTEITH